MISGCHWGEFNIRRISQTQIEDRSPVFNGFTTLQWCFPIPWVLLRARSCSITPCPRRKSLGASGLGSWSSQRELKWPPLDAAQQHYHPDYWICPQDHYGPCRPWKKDICNPLKNSHGLAFGAGNILRGGQLVHCKWSSRHVSIFGVMKQIQGIQFVLQLLTVSKWWFSYNIPEP